MGEDPLSIAFICIGNACRSQMAEGLMRHLGGPELNIYSAGSAPAGFVAKEARDALRELNIDISHHYSKGVEDLPKIEWDYVITMGCGDFCPTLKAKNYLEWDIADPVGLPLGEFRKVRDELARRIKALVTEWAKPPEPSAAPPSSRKRVE